MKTDKYTTELAKSLQVLMECQETHKVNSCMKCSKNYVNCDDRKRYVKSVYQSMNKGKEGNFEF